MQGDLELTYVVKRGEDRLREWASGVPLVVCRRVAMETRWSLLS